MANIDDRLLAGNTLAPEQEGDAAEELKNRRGSRAEEENQGGGLRERAMRAKQAMNLKDQAKKKLEEKVTAPARAGTSSALRWAWYTLIPSFGLSLIYINIHVFLRMVFGEKLFCKLGEEWIPREISAVGGEAGKSLSKSIGIIEAMGVLMLDLFAFFILLGVSAFLVMVVDFMQASWYEKAIQIIGGITKLGWTGIKSLFELF